MQPVTQVIPMSEAVWIFIIGAALSVIAFLVQSFLQRAILKKLDENDENIKALSEKQTSLNLEVANNFVKKADHEDHCAKDEAVHNKIWEDLGTKGERLAKVEERVNIRDEIRAVADILKGG